MNDKSKDTAKARQDLKMLGIRSGLWLGQNKNEKCSKPQAAYSFKPEDRKKLCQFIKGVKLPDSSEFPNKDMKEEIPAGFEKADVARVIAVTVAGDNHPPPHQIPTGCGVAWATETHFDMAPQQGIPIAEHRIYAPYQQHLQKIYNAKALLKEILTCVPTWNPIAGHKSMRPSSGICKRFTMARRLLSRKGIGFLTRTRLTTWSASDAYVPRTFPRSDDKFSQMLTQLESYPEIGGGNGSGGCGDDEPGDDEDGGEDGEDEDDS
ncbi:hypothetical protein Tco_1068522 [Tanacetum coccineum]|uniref:Uncharacterized protein n=1 Tax=Tanacetum coccineum TaxID=301880 RepID=A0ABQ5HHU8_9ASTR